MLAGRDEELTVVRRLLQGARMGAGAAVLVSGEAGIGKSALLDAVVAEADGCICVRVAGIESESALAYAGLHELVQPLEPSITELPEALQDPLLRAVRLDAATDGSVVAAALATLLLLTAERRPVVMVIDDVQWLDAPSTRAVMFAARRLRQSRILSLIAHRAGTTAPVVLDGLEELRLHPLDDEASAELVARTIADAADRDAVLRAAAGNPLAIIELGRAPGGVAGSAPDIADRLFGSRIRQLTEVEREALLVAALEVSGDASVVSRAVGGSAPLNSLSSKALVRFFGERLELRHPLLRTLVVDHSSAEDRRAAHARLSSAVAPGDLRVRYRALAASLPDEELAAELEDLGVRDGVTRDGAWALGRSATLSPPGPDRDRRWLLAAEALWDSGDLPGARMAIGEVTASRFQETRHGAAVLEARLMIAEGALVEGARKLTLAADEVASTAPAVSAALFVEAALALAGTQQVAAGLQLVQRARSVAPPDDPSLRLAVASAEADLTTLTGDLGGGARRALAAAREADADPRVHADRAGRLSLAEALFGGADYQRAREVCQAVIRDCRAAGALADLRCALSILFSVEVRCGRVPAMSVAAQEELELATQFGLLMEQEEALGHVAWCDALAGRAEECRSRVSQRLELGERVFPNPIPHPSLGVLELGLGRPKQAVVEIQRTMAALAARDLPPTITLMPHRPDLIEAYARAGDRGAARIALADLERETRAVGTADALALLHRCRGLLADVDIDEEFSRSLGYDDDEPRPLERARSLLCWGERLRRAKRRSDARTQLGVALEQFRRLGADLWTTRAYSELGAVGRHDLPRLEAPTVRLTRTEIRIAALVTEGMSNREVASSLFVSINTVETHLRHVFGKLGVRSRTELARKFTVIRDSELSL